MPSVSAAQHRWIAWQATNPAARHASGLSEAKAQEWLHADKGKPWDRSTGGSVRGYDSGGTVVSGSTSGISPAGTVGGTPVQGMNPLQQGMVQQLAAMPVQQLQQLVLRMGSSPQGQMAQRILQQKRMMPNSGAPQPAAQVPAVQSAPAVAQPTMARGGPIRRLASGGPALGVPMGMADPWWTRREASDSGFVHSSVPGRTDAINASPPVKSHVIPADVVSGLGEGNSLAGAQRIQAALETGPHGAPAGRASRGMGMPRPPRAAGGRVPIKVAGGEFIVSPERVKWLGDGDVKRGHDILDHWIVETRKRIIDTMKKLPGPAK